MSTTLRQSILKLLAEATPPPDPAAAPRPHLSIRAVEVVLRIGELRQPDRRMVAFHLGNFRGLGTNDEIQAALEELVADGLFQDTIRVVCPEGHTVTELTRAIADKFEGRRCIQCDSWFDRDDLSLQSEYVLTDEVRGPRVMPPQNFIAEATRLLTLAAEALQD